VMLRTLMVIPDAGDVKERIPGPYAIVLRDTLGAELARYPFTPEGMALGPDMPSDGPAGPEPELLGIYELVPYIDGTAQVDIEGPSGLLHSVTAGLAEPTLAITSPNGGEVMSGDPVVVSWTADDADGDTLRYSIEYSVDAGASWELLAAEIGETTVSLDAANVAGTDSGLFRVWASDGIHTVADISDATFTVPNRPPEAEIVSPQAGSTYAISQTVSFDGWAYDVETGTMADEQLSWTSDIDGLLGEGAVLSVAGLSEGEHTITFAADDGMGGTANDTVSITIIEDPADLPIADMLYVSPVSILLQPDMGSSTATLDIHNQNEANAIGWHAEADHPWIDLSDSDGDTPQQITVSYVESGLADGSHTTTITLTSLDVPGQTLYVPVEVIIGGENQLMLPLISKG